MGANVSTQSGRDVPGVVGARDAPAACARGNSAQKGPVRPGPTPSDRSRVRTVVAPTCRPSFPSSPWIRTQPQRGSTLGHSAVGRARAGRPGAGSGSSSRWLGGRACAARPPIRDAAPARVLHVSLLHPGPPGNRREGWRCGDCHGHVASVRRGRFNARRRQRHSRRGRDRGGVGEVVTELRSRWEASWASLDKECNAAVTRWGSETRLIISSLPWCLDRDLPTCRPADARSDCWHVHPETPSSTRQVGARP